MSKKKRTCHTCGKKYGKRTHSSADTYCSKGCHVSKKVERALCKPDLVEVVPGGTLTPEQSRGFLDLCMKSGVLIPASRAAP